MTKELFILITVELGLIATTVWLAQHNNGGCLLSGYVAFLIPAMMGSA